MITISIDDAKVEVVEGATILDAAKAVGIYIPTLCSHPNLPPSKGKQSTEFVYRGSEKIEGRNDGGGKEFEGCQLCLVEIQGKEELVTACNTPAQNNMVVLADTPRVKDARQKNLIPILANHPHACLTCAQREGCSRTQCSANVSVEERCCIKLGRCELQRVADYIGIRSDTPRYVPRKLPKIENEPLFIRDTELCISCIRCVRACDDMRGIGALSFTYDGMGFIVGTSRGPSMAESDCRFCGACVEVCPTGALLDKDVSFSEREEQLVPCKNACPVGIDVPRIMRLVGEGRFAEATTIVREKAPFPLTLGSVCFHPCEEECRRGEMNEPIAICNVKRFAAENDTDEWKVKFKRAPSTDKKVAIVGGGPSGLTAGYYLSMLGHSVTVFDSNPNPGGMLNTGIPSYRLPPEIVEEDMKGIMESGLEFKGGVTIGRDVLIQDLKSKNYDAIYVAAGATLSKKIPLEGSDLDDVLWGLDFLQDVKKGKEVKVRDRIVVIGGGNVAMDVALTALRLGAKEIDVACLESREEMPAFEWEIQEALDEGIRMHVSWGPKRIIGDGGKIKGIELKRCTSVFDEQGRFNPKFDESETTQIESDIVILAIGQSPDTTFSKGLDDLNMTRGGNVIIEPESLKSNIEGIYAGGDIVTGPKSVIEAVDMGRRAAISIDKRLGGKGNIEIKLLEEEKPNQKIGRIEGFANLKRVEIKKIPKEARRNSFDHVEIGYDKESAVSEASRCLKCDLRLLLETPLMPPEKWLDFNEVNLASVPEAEGVYQLLDENKEVLRIAGTANLKVALTEELEKNEKARYFIFEEDKMYTKRETELLQEYMQQHGKMPGGEDELDELF